MDVGSLSSYFFYKAQHISYRNAAVAPKINFVFRGLDRAMLPFTINGLAKEPVDILSIVMKVHEGGSQSKKSEILSN